MAEHGMNPRRPARRRRHKPGDLAALTRVLWQAILEGEAILARPESDEQALRAIHALSQACGQYSRLLSQGELESRVAALEATVAQGGHDGLAG